MLGNQDLRRNLINKSIKINTTQNDVSKGYIVILMKSLSLHRLGVVPPSILATSSLTSLVMKLLRFAAEAKKLSNHHRTPIFWSVIQPGERNLTSLKWPTAHKFPFGCFCLANKHLVVWGVLYMVSVIEANQREKVILGAQLSYQI